MMSYADLLSSESIFFLRFFSHIGHYRVEFPVLYSGLADMF